MAQPLFGTTFSYNGYNFPSNVKTTVTEELVMSEDGRVLKSSKIGITARWWLLTDETAPANVQATATANVDGAGVLLSLTITNGGSGYTAPPLISFSGGGGGAGAAATTTLTNGVVTGYAIQNQGAGYTVAPTVTIGAPPVVPPATTDAVMESIRRKLSKPGKRLVYANKGFGAASLTVDPNGPIRDIAFGPHPGPLKFTPFGGAPLGNIAALLEWSVSTTILECTTAVNTPGPGRYTQLAYSVNYTVDRAGFNVVTVSGSIEIPLMLGADGVSQAGSADDNWAEIVGPVPFGFERNTQRSLSPDRRRLDFTITDKQLPVPLPRDIIAIDLHHRVHNKSARDLFRFTSTISGSVTTSPAARRDAGYKAFYDLVLQRIERTLTTLPNGVIAGGVIAAAVGAALVRITNFSADEAIFDNTTSFSITYEILKASLANILRASGLWMPPNTDWASWEASLRDNAHAPTGWSNLTYSRDRDTILDICAMGGAAGGRLGVGGAADGGNNNPPAAGGTTTVPEPGTLVDAGGADGPTNTNGPDNGKGGKLLSFVDPTTSWIDYDANVTFVQDGMQVRHKPLTGTIKYIPPAVDPLADVAPMAADTTLPTLGTTGDTADNVQQVASPSGKLILSGYARRFGYAIPVPRLVQYAGIPLDKPSRAVVTAKVASVTQGIPENMLLWMIEYILPTLPATLPQGSNPFLGTTGG